MKIQGHEVIFTPKTASTNSLAEEMLRNETLQNGSVVRTDFQTAGKGMMNNSWQSEEGKNLLFSLYRKNPGLRAENQFYLSKATSLAIHDMLTENEAFSNVKIKWPNDVLVNENKIAGTLIQCGLRNSDVMYSIIGIGLNVNQEDFANEFKATSMMIEKKVIIDLDKILADLLMRLDKYLDMIKKQEFTVLDELYHQHLLGNNQWLKFSKAGMEFKGRIKRVKENGLIELEDENGGLKNYEIKEISLVSTQPISPPAY